MGRQCGDYPRRVSGPLDRIASCGVLPVVELPPNADPIALVDALVAGGLDTIEITLRTPGALEAIRSIRTSRPNVLVAAGSILTTDQADAAIDAGAALLVSPGLSDGVVGHALERGIAILPGVCTPTEVELGLARGLAIFKFFPAAAAGGPPFLAALGGPYPHVRFVPTGGIDASTVRDYLELPNVLACGGSWMVGRRLLADRDMAAVERLAREAGAIVRSSRGVPADPPGDAN